MTPERAAELAREIGSIWRLGNMAEAHIRDAILAACKEQKEADAKICEEYAEGGIGGWKHNTPADCAKAIRSSE